MHSRRFEKIQMYQTVRRVKCFSFEDIYMYILAFNYDNCWIFAPRVEVCHRLNLHQISLSDLVSISASRTLKAQLGYKQPTRNWLPRQIRVRLPVSKHPTSLCLSRLKGGISLLCSVQLCNVR